MTDPVTAWKREDERPAAPDLYGKIERLQSLGEDMADRIAALEAENARMRDALGFYAKDCDATLDSPCTLSGSRCCVVARAALAEGE